MSIAKRLSELDLPAMPTFGYDEMLQRHERRLRRSATRLRATRYGASALVVALIGASVWRWWQGGAPPEPLAAATFAPPSIELVASQPSIVRADTYLAVAALEDHIAGLDEALNVARLRSPGGAEVARLESTRAELVDSWSRVRYAEMVSTRF